MIGFHNSSRVKVVRDMLDFHRLPSTLVKRIDYTDLIIEEITKGKRHLIITSLFRFDSIDHNEGTAWDNRAHELSHDECSHCGCQ